MYPLQAPTWLRHAVSKVARMRKAWKFPAVAFSLAVVLAGCAQAGPSGESSAQPPAVQSAGGQDSPAGPPTAEVEGLKPRADAPQGFAGYYDQQIDWQVCQAEEVVADMLPTPKDLENYQCGTFEAPMDWHDPDSAPIEMAVARYVGDQGGEDGPALFYNLGGPGGDAVQSLSSVVSEILTRQVVDTFQVVAVDPRGVGQSSPIWCLTDEERDAKYARDDNLDDMTPQQRVDFYTTEISDFGAKCQERNGEILGHVDSDSATRDFDLARALLDQSQLNYIGFSYGTVLGATYAELFPQRTGRLVLDGALDPQLDVNELSALQLGGMEASLYNWIETCQAGRSCPLSGDLESGKQQMIDFLEGAAENPIPTQDPDRPLNGNLAYTAVIGSMYNTQMYPLLTEGIQQAKKGDASTLLFLADYYNDRGKDGVFTSNSADAFVAVNALDYPPVGTLEDWERTAEELGKNYPVLGGDFGYASAGLDAWPVQATNQRRKLTAPEAPALLVIGTTNDPATPYVMAESLADSLQSATLITVEGWDHTAYRSTASDCVIGAVDRFLINGEVPQDGLVCE